MTVRRISEEFLKSVDLFLVNKVSNLNLTPPKLLQTIFFYHFQLDVSLNLFHQLGIIIFILVPIYLFNFCNVAIQHFLFFNGCDSSIIFLWFFIFSKFILNIHQCVNIWSNNDVWYFYLFLVLKWWVFCEMAKHKIWLANTNDVLN